MADVELLPLPRWMETYRIPGDDFHTGPDQYLSERMQSYARANIAPLQTEIKALRAEMERLRADRDSWEQQASDRVADWHAEHLRAERLAEALRELVDVFSESCMYDEEVFAKARAALAQGNRND